MNRPTRKLIFVHSDVDGNVISKKIKQRRMKYLTYRVKMEKTEERRLAVTTAPAAAALTSANYSSSFQRAEARGRFRSLTK